MRAPPPAPLDNRKPYFFRKLGPRAGLPASTWHAILEQLIEHGMQGTPIACAARNLFSRCTTNAPELRPELMVSLLGRADGRAPVVAWLQNTMLDTLASWYARLQTAARMRGVDLDGVFEEVCAAQLARLDSYWSDAWAPWVPELLAQMQAAALRAPVDVCLRFYEGLLDDIAAARLLHRILATQPHDHLRAHLAAVGDSTDEQVSLRRRWLRGCLEG